MTQLFDWWDRQDEATAFEIHQAYVGAHPARRDRFLEHLDELGYDTTDLAEFASFAALDDTWRWLIADTELPLYQPDVPLPWQGPPTDRWPDLGGYEPPPDWPPWCNHAIADDALELVSGIAGAITEIAINVYDGQWRFGDAATVGSTRGPSNNRTVVEATGALSLVWFVEPYVLTWYAGAVSPSNAHRPEDRTWWNNAERALQTKLVDDGDQAADIHIEEDTDLWDAGERGWYKLDIDPDIRQDQPDIHEIFAEYLRKQRPILDARDDGEVVMARLRRNPDPERAEEILTDIWNRFNQS